MLFKHLTVAFSFVSYICALPDYVSRQADSFADPRIHDGSMLDNGWCAAAAERERFLIFIDVSWR